ncbi:hypothetical protein PIB30_012012 [Stylosanthes scabra]|uniref:Uncharacterized protein n=1 Tax=Stylosanthes scabra TaxID=79078 RepID=A0ABU6Y351_9FABA|nr:hypothetical protein [Stylosanthes scabra]
MPPQNPVALFYTGATSSCSVFNLDQCRQLMQRLQLTPVPPVDAASSDCTSAASSSSGIHLTPSSGTGSPNLLQCHCNMRRHSLVLVQQRSQILTVVDASLPSRLLILRTGGVISRSSLLLLRASVSGGTGGDL